MEAQGIMTAESPQHALCVHKETCVAALHALGVREVEQPPVKRKDGSATLLEGAMDH